MGEVALCRLSTKRLALLREDPALARALPKQIRSGSVPNAVWVGRFENEKDRSAPDLIGGNWSALTRRERLEARFSIFGANAWKWIREILDGQVGGELRSNARVLSPLLVARAAAAMGRSPKPAPANSIESVADAIRTLLETSRSAGDHVLVLGPARSRRPSRHG